MSADDEKDDPRSVIVDVVAAVVLGIVTSLAAFGAYQSSLYGGNQATAYTEAINTFGEANRELLRGVQERAYDTTIWLEHLKAQQREKRKAGSGGAEPGGPTEAPAPDPEPAPKAPASKPDEAAKPKPKAEPASKAAAASRPAEAAKHGTASKPPADDDDDDDGLSEADLYEFLAVSLARSFAEETGETTVAEKLTRLLKTRRDLTGAMKWADEEHARNMKAMSNEQRMVHARRLIKLFAEEDDLVRASSELVAKFQKGRTRVEIDAAIDADAAASAERKQLDAKLRAVNDEAERLVEMMAKPNFFDSPAYQKAVDGKYEELLAKGTQTFNDGQAANEVGDQFTLATVFLTVALFFCGLAPIMRRFPLKAAFLSVGLVIAIGATTFMLRYPLA